MQTKILTSKVDCYLYPPKEPDWQDDDEDEIKPIPLPIGWEEYLSEAT